MWMKTNSMHTCVIIDIKLDKIKRWHDDQKEGNALRLEPYLLSVVRREMVLPLGASGNFITFLVNLLWHSKLYTTYMIYNVVDRSMNCILDGFVENKYRRVGKTAEKRPRLAQLAFNWWVCTHQLKLQIVSAALTLFSPGCCCVYDVGHKRFAVTVKHVGTKNKNEIIMSDLWVLTVQ